MNNNMEDLSSINLITASRPAMNISLVTLSVLGAVYGDDNNQQLINNEKDLYGDRSVNETQLICVTGVSSARIVLLEGKSLAWLDDMINEIEKEKSGLRFLEDEESTSVSLTDNPSSEDGDPIRKVQKVRLWILELLLQYLLLERENTILRFRDKTHNFENADDRLQKFIQRFERIDDMLVARIQETLDDIVLLNSQMAVKENQLSEKDMMIDQLENNVTTSTSLITSMADKIQENDITMKQLEDEITTLRSQCTTKEEDQKPKVMADRSAPKVYEKKFDIFQKNVSWHDAMVLCYERNMNLATLRNKKENDAFTALARQKGIDSVWLGGVKGQNNDNDWYWVPDGQRINYTNWDVRDHQPDNMGGEEKCLSIRKYHGWKWNDLECKEYRFYYGCESYEQTDAFHPQHAARRCLNYFTN